MKTTPQYVFASGSGSPTPVVNDLELITRIKTLNDSAAVTELVHRHTGAYMSVIQQYQGSPDFRARVNVPDLRDDKFLNIYQWALTYDPTRPSEVDKKNPFGRHVFEQTKYLCKSVISRGKESVELVTDTLATQDMNAAENAERDSVLETVREEVKATDDPLFRRIFKLRHGGKRPMSWREIATRVGMTHEGARKAFNKHMGLIKEHART